MDATSRYFTWPTVTVTKRNGTPVQICQWQPRTQTSFPFTSMVLGSRRVDEVAQQVFQDPTLWWQIAWANPEVMVWVDVPSTQVVRVPNTYGLA